MLGIVRENCDVPTDAALLFAGLAGSWAQTRVITPGGAYVGQASFAPLGAGILRYSENGIITLAGGGRLQASRRYAFKLEAGRIAVYFEEAPPRLFHVLQFKPGTGTETSMIAVAEHRCGDDGYHSTYAMHAPDHFTVTHRVAGPRKGYVMTTDYRRIG